MEEKIKIIQGDITELDVDAIVNAANPRLLGGGGVDGAIHRAAGPELQAACRVFGGCATGEACLTPGFRLKAHFVIHTPGPVWQGGKYNEEILLKRSYQNSLALAQKENCRSIAFPAISTGIYGFPKKKASVIAFKSIASYCDKNNYYPEIILVAYSNQDHAILKAAHQDFLAWYRDVKNTL